MSLAIRRTATIFSSGQIRALSSSGANRQDHHSYFRPDDNLVRFPDNSRFGPLGHPTARAEPTAAPTSSSDGSHRGSDRTGNTLANWSIFFAGFLAYPLVFSFLKVGDWAFGTEASVEAGADVNRARMSSTDGLMQAHALQRILDRSNEETKTLHLMIHRMIRPEGLHAITDQHMLSKNPIKMSDGQSLGANKARLVRLVNKEGKTLAMLLAVDTADHPPTMKDPQLAWAHDFALRKWMDRRAAELSKGGEEADPEQGIVLFCYTASSSGTCLPRLEQKGATWQECRLPPGDMPPGFPLNAFDGVPSPNDGNQ